jgi:tetratricopeptide (TPR) repeat protein
MKVMVFFACLFVATLPATSRLVVSAPSSDQKIAWGEVVQGLACEERGKHDCAVGKYDRAIRIDPTNAEAYYLRGDVQFQLGAYAKAVRDYNIALKLNAKLLPAYLSRAAAYTKLGNKEAAMADFAAALRLRPDDQVH